MVLSVILTVCAFNFVWSSVKPKITGKPRRNYQQLTQQQPLIQPTSPTQIPTSIQSTFSTPDVSTTFTYSSSGTIAPSLKICPNCKNAELETVKFCRKCGHVL